MLAGKHRWISGFCEIRLCLQVNGMPIFGYTNAPVNVNPCPPAPQPGPGRGLGICFQ